MNQTKTKIKVDNLEKKYRISHQQGYLTLRDLLARKFKDPFGFKANKINREEFFALKGVSFSVTEGEVVGIIGRNGAGKTTLLKILSRITCPSAGQVRLCGRVGSLLEVGTGFHPELTGRENIFFNGAILGMKRREILKKFDEIVDFSGVAKFLDTPVKRFSSGMQVRLAFSVAAHLEPEILLVDEVLAVGDAQFQRKCLGKMKEVSRSGRTVLFVSHNMNAIRNLCTRVILLESGRLSQEGHPDEVVNKYLDQNLALSSSISGCELEARLEGVIKKSDPTIRFVEVALLNDHDESVNFFDADRPIKISVTYECLISVHDLRVVVQLVDDDNRPIVISQNTDNENENSFYERKPGLYRSVCVIPANLLGQKRFYLTLHLINLKTEHLVLNKVLMFDVVFRGFNLQLGDWVNTFIRPALNWDTRKLLKE